MIEWQEKKGRCQTFPIWVITGKNSEAGRLAVTTMEEGCFVEAGALERQIYRVRVRMQRLALEKGLSSPEVLAVSQRLDKLIVQSQRLRQESRRNEFCRECV